jgi:hypothetical protein
MRRTIALLAVIAATTLTACAKPAVKVETPMIPTGDALVIRVEFVDGFVPIEFNASRLPLLSVYADGRVLTQGAQPAIYPGPALPNIEERLISRDDVARLAGLAIAAGVGSGADYGQPNVMDAPSTKFTVNTADRTYQSSANALGIESGGGLTSAQRKARQKLQDLLEKLTDLPKTLGSGAVGKSKPYEAASVSVLASPYTPPTDIPAPAKAEWPGPDLPGTPFVRAAELSCVTVTGMQAQAVLGAAAKANTATGWTAKDQTWHLTFRPLLPDESDCDDLKTK